MNFVKNRSYFIATTDAVIRTSANKKSKPKNHLIFGDWLKYLGNEKSGWIEVYSRGTGGWLPKSAVSDKRVLEINFVDIGQGDGCHIVTPEDEIILLDAGAGDNMSRFIHWRYNLRGRKVAGIDEVTSNTPGVRPPMEIDHVVISHPDKDHYYGFKPIFDCKKLKVKNIYHNGIFERPIKPEDKAQDLHYYSKEDLGGYVAGPGRTRFLWDVVASNKEMHQLIKKHRDSRKDYLSTMVSALENNRKVKFKSLSVDDGYFAHFGGNNPVRFKILGPVTEIGQRGNDTKKCLIRLKSEGVTKNGHSVVFQLQIGKLKVLLGGDLNTESEDYLFKHYCKTNASISKLEKRVSELVSKGDHLSVDEKQDLAEARATIDDTIIKARRHFQVDVAKACHHGSHHFSETFLKALNAIATVISSGDNESYAHPRPDALGSFGKYGRGIRPLIFSTEIARSTHEFSKVYEYYDQLKAFEKRIELAETKKEKRAIQKEMQEKKDRNVAVYGMITLRTNGEKVVLAQKLEVKGGNDRKWDIHELQFSEARQEFEYHKKGGH